ncbi:MAG TPA: HD domain-containing protein [Pirellulales bacterium]|jgi:HD superfamily phosphohydrolase
MSTIRDIPEVAGLDAQRGLIRIPPELDVPLTDRVRQILDTKEFRRLARISQLGLVSLVYPAAIHTRFEHSLGVFRLALLYLRQLAHDERFVEAIRPADAEIFIVAALLHDLGHWPFCHPIEDIRLPGVPDHEMFANSFLLEGEIADALRTDWNINPRDVVALLSGKPRDAKSRILRSMLSGPIDIDKMDYLGRDSLHAGVPYGRHFDQGRLLASLCLNMAGDGLAIIDKGKTAAEMMVFARYVMFSEVYWHHAVRSATAMLQRAFYLVHHDLDLDALLRLSEAPLIAALDAAAGQGPARELLAGLFGPTRRLYKRVDQYSFFERRDLYDRLAHQPYPWLVACAEQFAGLASAAVGRVIAPHEVLFDAPPVAREVEFNIEIYFPKRQHYRTLGEVSPMIRALAREQFDDYVKRVRIFAHARVASELRDLPNLPALVEQAVDRTG